MIEIVGFAQWHRTAIYDILRKRAAGQRARSVRLEYVSQFSAPDAPASLGSRWTAFVAAVGARAADGWWARVCAAAALSGLPGVIRADRESFGPRALWRDDDPVTAAEGVLVYDALVSSGLAREVTGAAPTEAQRIVDEIVRDVETRTAARSTAATAARKPARKAAERAARKADGPAAVPPAATSARPAADTPADPAADPASPVVVVVVGGTTPPLPSPGGEGSVEVASPGTAEAAAPPPLTDGERAVAAVLRRALENVKLRVETPTQAAARQRAAQFALTGPTEDRARAEAERKRLVAEESERRQRVIADLAGDDPAAARRWIEQLRGEQAVAVQCAMASKGAERDARARRRESREAARNGSVSTAMARTLKDLSRTAGRSDDLGRRAAQLLAAYPRDQAWHAEAEDLFDEVRAEMDAAPAGAGA